MKKYEAPIVELTKFDVEDVITASVTMTEINVTTDTNVDLDAIAGEIAATEGTGLDGVFSW